MDQSLWETCPDGIRKSKLQILWLGSGIVEDEVWATSPGDDHDCVRDEVPGQSVKRSGDQVSGLLVLDPDMQDLFTPFLQRVPVGLIDP